MPFSQCERTDNVHLPDGERPWGDEAVQLFWLNMVEGAELLTLGTFFHILDIVPLDGRPVVACSQDFRGHSSCPRVISTDSFVDLDQDILSLLAGDDFNRGAK